MDAPQREHHQGRVGIIDMIAHDPKTDEAVLVMNEPERWDDSEEQLFHLQERFNTYVAFLLDGEFAEWIESSPKSARGSKCGVVTCPARERSNCSPKFALSWRTRRSTYRWS